MKKGKEPTERLELALQETDLHTLKKVIFQERYIRVLKEFEIRCFRFAILFHTLRILVSIGSLIVPALLSIQYSDTSSSTTIKDPDSFAYEIYWATWVISLLVTTSNGILTVFKIDKKYYFLHTTMEQLRSEGWQYLELSGRYSGFYGPNPTHENQFIYFSHAVEKIKMRQVEEEYFKLAELHSHTQPSQTNDSKQEKKENLLIHPTPAISLGDVYANLPVELRKQLKSIAQVDGSNSLPMSTDVPTSSTPEKTILRVSSDAEMSESLSA